MRIHSRALRTWLAVGGLATASLTIVGAAASAAQASEIDLEAAMGGSASFPGAHGHAEFDNDASHREFDLSVGGLQALAGHRVVVRVHGDVVARPTVGPRGRVHVDRHSGVPQMAAGNVVRLRTSSGTLVSSGTFRVHPDD